MPSLVGGRDMNSYDFDRGGRTNGTTANGGFNQYRDDFGREDMRRDDDDGYRRVVRNGGPSFDRFNTDYLDQNSLSDFRSNEPKFELDHLATFASGPRNGVIHAEDGLRKLRQMENTTGIWTMRCILIVERNSLVILDNSTGEELEKFPIQLVQDPTAIFKNDRREIYNNLILFTIVDDPKKRTSQGDMHIFQSSKAPAQEIVDEILAAKNGQQRLPLYQGDGSRILPPPAGPAPEPPSKAYNFQRMRELIDSRQIQTNNTASDMHQFNQTSYSQGGQFGGPINPQRSFITRVNTLRERENVEGGSTEVLERDVQLLNHCFDDIEKFVARLQQAAESYKELEKRKRDRGAKSKKRQSGDGMLNARARPPPDRDFVDIFQKFKLSFNLLAKLKAHIHDPNAPELVHFLFTPLSLIYEASRDPYHGNQNLGDQAVAPVLTGDAKQLLLNCLTSKEIELWQALGKHWTTSRDEWQGPIPPYIPEFYDGWQPAAGIDELTSRAPGLAQPAIMAAPLPMIEPARTQAVVEDRHRGYNALQRPMPFPDEDRSIIDRYHHQDDFERFELSSRGIRPNSRDFEPRGFQPVNAPSTSRAFEPNPPRNYEPSQFKGQSQERSPPNSGMGSPFSSDFLETHGDRTGRQEIPKNINRDPIPSAASRQDENVAYFEELRRMGDAIIYEAAHDRVGKNAKELTVQRGDILQVMDSSKNWWKLRNYKGEVGFAPYTILKAVKTEREDSFERFDRLPNGVPPSRTSTSEASFAGEERSPGRRDPSSGTSSRNAQQGSRPRSQSISPPPAKRYVSPSRRTRRESPHDDARHSLTRHNSPLATRRRSSSFEGQDSSHIQWHGSVLLSNTRHSPTPQAPSPPPLLRDFILPSNRGLSPTPQRRPSQQRRISATLQRRPSPSPQRRTSPIPQRRTSPIPQRRTSPIPQRRTSPIPQRRTSPIPTKRALPTHQRQLSAPIKRHGSIPPSNSRYSPTSQKRDLPTQQTRRSPSPQRHASPTHQRRPSITLKRRVSIIPPNRLYSPTSQKRDLPTQQTRRSPSPQKHASPTHQRRPSITLKRRASILPPNRPYSRTSQKRDSPTQQTRRSPSPQRRRSNMPVYENNTSEPRARVSKKISSYVNTSATTHGHGARAPDINVSPKQRTSPSFRGGPKPNVVTRTPKGHVPAPPPLPPRSDTKPSYVQDSSRNDAKQKNTETGKNAKVKLHEELRNRISRVRSFKTQKEHESKHHKSVTTLDHYSSAQNVTEWMTNKGFSDLAVDTYGDYTGMDMFQLRLPEIEEVLGHEEAVRLDGLLTLQKSSSGYATRSAKELNDILRRRKHDIEPDSESLLDVADQSEDEDF